MQELIKIKIKNEDINFVNTLNFLGLCFNAELNWKDHINVIRKKISKSLGIINCVRNFFPIIIKNSYILALYIVIWFMA